MEKRLYRVTRADRMTLFGWLATFFCLACTISAIIGINLDNYLGGAILLSGSWIDGILALVAFDRAEKSAKGVK